MTWLDLSPGDPYGIHNLPYGVFTRSEKPDEARIGVRVGDAVLDLHAAEEADLIESDGVLGDGDGGFAGRTLNAFMARGRAAWTAARTRITELLTDPAHRTAVEPLLVPLAEVTMRMPFEVADYVDFYCFEHHATNVGRMFRPDQAPLLPNWKRLPVGYHGRSGTVVVSGADIVRPSGQRRGTKAPTPSMRNARDSAPSPDPVFGPSTRLDIETEVGFVVGTPSRLGSQVPADQFAEHVFGIVLLNDWSARDIQAWEYQPLGPFLGKSFATSISPWVVPLDALSAAEVEALPQDPAPLPYLSKGRGPGYDLRLSVSWNGTVVAEPPFREMYWTPAQQLAHLTVNGASLRTGDLYASGTVSGPEKRQRGCFLELTWSGAEPVTLSDGAQRTFLEDGDTVTITGFAPGPGGTMVGLGEVTGAIRPAIAGSS
ncbi:MAG: fumarylacetoacetase [Micromonosporaceae bacterium]|nr:fumarylacetoacetase [Micromonosporaceae bacterium]